MISSAKPKQVASAYRQAMPAVSGVRFRLQIRAVTTISQMHSLHTGIPDDLPTAYGTTVDYEYRASYSVVVYSVRST